MTESPNDNDFIGSLGAGSEPTPIVDDPRTPIVDDPPPPIVDEQFTNVKSNSLYIRDDQKKSGSDLEVLDIPKAPEATMYLKVQKFVFDFTNAAFRNDYDFPAEILDWSGCRILTMVSAIALKRECLSARISATELSKKCFGKLGRMAVKRRLKGFAEWGFITVDTTAWRDTAKGKRVQESSLIRINSGFPVIFGGAGALFRRNFIADLLSFGAFRADRGAEDNRPYQGFSMVVGYGKPEHPGEKIYELFGSGRSEEAIEKEKSDKVSKAAENKRWLKLKDQFISAASNVWIMGQTADGLGQEKPSWCGSTSTMSASAKRERSELTKTFESYGGSVTSLAWLLFCNGVPVLDKHGQPEYDRYKPHKQFVFIDKRPSQFTKNFNALLKDPEFKKYSTLSWPEMSAELKNHFGDSIIDEEPREGHHKDRLGYALGDKHIRPSSP